MTHDDIIQYFGSNKRAAHVLHYSKQAISAAQHRGVSYDMQIRAFHVSNGALHLDEKAQEYFDFLMANDTHQKAA